MKKFCLFILISLSFFSFLPSCPKLSCQASQEKRPMMAIVIDDFGGYDQSGVETMLSIDAPLTCAVMPLVDNTQKNVEQIKKANKEVILHMPMQAHVNLPLSWYGNIFIGSNDSKQEVYEKMDKAISSVGDINGFNIHIGSGVCQNPNVVQSIYGYAQEHNLYFLDSRTHLNTICQNVAKENNIVYLGCDEFLEPDGNRSYEGVKHHLMIGANLAKEKGYSIVIGHVGSHGGENTAKAIKDSIETIKNMGIEIVSLTELNNSLKK